MEAEASQNVSGAGEEGFDPGHWSIEDRAYGIFIMLACRTEMPDSDTKPPEVATLKFVESRVLESRSAVHSSHDRPVPSDDEDDEADLIPEGEPVEPTDTAAWPGRRGSWWRVQGSLQEDVIVRDGVSLQSKEVRRIVPGELVQQAGSARALVQGRAKGCIRVPVQPSGWVTADAQKAGGPKYLVRAEAPRWQVVYGSSSQNGDNGKGVIMRAEPPLDSEEVAFLQFGAIVEQAGPSVTRPDGIIRMPVIAQVSCRRDLDTDDDDSESSDFEADNTIKYGSAKTFGWVTTDATAAGGPLFFKAAPTADHGTKNKKKWVRRNNDY